MSEAPAGVRAAVGHPPLRIVFRPLMSLAPTRSDFDAADAQTRVGCARSPPPAPWRARAGRSLLRAGCVGQGRRSNANLIVGKQAFVAKCGACHTLARANTKGDRRPQPRRSLPRERRRRARAQHDPRGRRRPGRLPQPRRRDAARTWPAARRSSDIAAYVAQVGRQARHGHRPAGERRRSARRGQARGREGRQARHRRQPQRPARLRHQQGRPRPPAPVTIEMPNMSGVSHNIAVESGEGGHRQGRGARREPVHHQGHRVGHAST